MTKQELLYMHQTIVQASESTQRSANDMLAKESVRRQTKDNLVASAKEHDANIKVLSESLVDNKAAMGVLNTVKDMNTAQSYAFIEHNLNIALEKVFEGSVRRIRLVEGAYNSKYPELKLELITENGVKRTLKTDSGHGLRQVVSLLCTLCLICVSGARRFLVLDEVLNGLSAESRYAVDDILWAFAGIGFQFITVEHGFIAHGSHVYQLKLENGVSKCVKDYIANTGMYLDKSTEAYAARAAEPEQ